MTTVGVKEFFAIKENRAKTALICSFTVTFAFAVFNGVLGIVKKSVWNGSISVYYFALLLIKGLIIFTELKSKSKEENYRRVLKQRIFITTTVLLFFIDIALIAPIALMVLNKKEVDIGMIPAIAIATYTTYKVIYSIIKYKSVGRNPDLTARQLRTINLVDAVLSVLTLQNTLIFVNDKTQTRNLTVLTAISSFIGLAVIIALSVCSLIRFLKDKQQ